MEWGEWDVGGVWYHFLKVQARKLSLERRKREHDQALALAVLSAHPLCPVYLLPGVPVGSRVQTSITLVRLSADSTKSLVVSGQHGFLRKSQSHLSPWV